jgi:lambda repressor-like predicted transcriptional regulator
MSRSDGITLEELYELKEQIDEGKPRERVLAAIGRKQGDHLDTLAERHGVVEKTIRNWLDRFEEEVAYMLAMGVAEWCPLPIGLVNKAPSAFVDG